MREEGGKLEAVIRQRYTCGSTRAVRSVQVNEWIQQIGVYREGVE